MRPMISRGASSKLSSKFRYAALNTARFSSSSTSSPQENDTATKDLDSKDATSDPQSTTSWDPTNATKKSTTLQQDEELQRKMAGLSGDGGEAGVEYEDGQPVSMKRSVKNNMFRYI